MNEEILYVHTSGGRSGHILKDVFTSVILGELLNLKTVYSDSWYKQKILDIQNVKAVIPSPQNSNRIYLTPRINLIRQKIRIGIIRKIIRKYLICEFFDGISPEVFEKFKKIVDVNRHRKNVLYITSGVYRIHLYQVANWELLGLVKKGSYEKIRSKLIKMYWGEEEPNKPNLEVKNIVIHARRGDVADPSDKHYFTMGPGNWTIDFYREKIGKIRKMYPQAKITVLSEKLNSEDLSTIPGVSLDLGDVEDIQRHFKMMVTADLFMPADSSLSTWAAYLSEGKILVTEKTIKHFDFLKEPESWIRL